MLTIRKSSERGHLTNDWLDSYHSFSFGEYYDPDNMGVSLLRVINEDRIIPDAGFPTHPHRNMEIVTYILSGELAHKDSMGNGSIIGAGEVQRMSAGKGITHSEFNPSKESETHLLQIWLLPKRKGIEPGYEQQYFSGAQKQGQLRLLVSDDGREGSVTANSDALMYGTLLAAGEEVRYTMAAHRLVYVHVARGEVEINGQLLIGGDAATLIDEASVVVTGKNSAEVLLFDLPRR